MKASRILFFILLLGAVLRFLFILHSDHIFYPDEIFQVLEQGYRLVYGYGLVPWEFRMGMRSWLVPGVVAGWLWFLKSIGITTPRVYILIIQSFFIILSLSLIISSYVLLKRISGSVRLALLSAFSVAVWYELIYFAPRPLIEVLATYCLISALALLVNAKSQYSIGLGAFLTGLGIINHATPLQYSVIGVYLDPISTWSSQNQVFALGTWVRSINFINWNVRLANLGGMVLLNLATCIFKSF